MLLALGRVLKLAASNFRRNLWLSVATITVMVLAIATYHVVVLLKVVSNTALSAIEQKIDVGAYLAPSVSDESARALKASLEKLPSVAEVTVVSKDDALAAFTARRGSSDVVKQALTEVGGNPFGAQLKIRAKDAQSYSAVIKALDDPAVIPRGTIEQKSYDDHREFIDRFQLYSGKATRIVQGFGLLLLLISFFVVLNTIRIAIYTHREEIGIMKLVGAGNWFVRTPFILEGVLYSIVATVLGTLLVFGVLALLNPAFNNFFAGAPVNVLGYYESHGLLIVGVQLLALSIINALGAAIAVGRYLNV